MMSLFAVITDLPLSNNCLMYSFPGSRPPRTSITNCIESSCKISSKLSVSKEESKLLSFDVSATSTFFTSISTRSSSISKRRSITEAPIFPAPSTAIV